MLRSTCVSAAGDRLRSHAAIDGAVDEVCRDADAATDDSKGDDVEPSIKWVASISASSASDGTAATKAGDTINELVEPVGDAKSGAGDAPDKAPIADDMPVAFEETVVATLSGANVSSPTASDARSNLQWR